MDIKPIAIISTDKHLKEDNSEELVYLAAQEIELAKENNVNTVIWLGDIFDSRLSQRQELLAIFSEIIEMYYSEGLEIICIPGNHDKTNYESSESFLTPFKYHPGFKLIDEPETIFIGNLHAAFIPFFSQDIWLQKFESLPDPVVNNKNILFSHTAVQGSVNNDGSVVSNKIPLSLFKGYDKVFLGHYHDVQQLAPNVFHLPSTRQNNFGENDTKGFAILYDDTSFGIVKADFIPYINIKIDVMNTSKEEIIELSKIQCEEKHVRVTLIGTQESVKSINKKLFTDRGISVKTKFSEIEVYGTEPSMEVVSNLTGQNIKDKFKEFCVEKNYEFSEGFKLLKEIMKWQE